MSPPFSDSDYPYGHDQFISAAGAAWSIRSLAQALLASAVAANAPIAATPSAETWIEKAVFGSVAELHRLLDDGLDPNASTIPDKTTPLMMAAAIRRSSACCSIAEQR
jgi:hypothetical protein